MDNSKIINFPKISLKNTKEIDEKYIQNYIESDPSVLGLGKLDVIEKERIQQNAGRMDFFLKDPNTGKRYEVELQLGKTDASHIIRTIEYWDIERKRYPKCDHCAVIIAEDITTRFLNVIQLFNGHIPLIAIQMSALKIDDKIALDFTKILNEIELADDSEDEDIIVDRKYWEEEKSTKEIVALADKILEIVNEFEPNFKLNYNQQYIGFVKNNVSLNFVKIYAKKGFFRLKFRLEENEENEKIISDSELDLDYRNNRYGVRLTENEITAKRETIKELLKRAYEYFK
jgi:hypothetical protein